MDKKTPDEQKKPIRKGSKTSNAETPKKKKPVLSVVKAFRLSENDGAIWDQKVAAADMTESEFIRLAVIQNRTVVQGVKRVFRSSPITLETLRLLSKQSNNMNQIAKRLNEARLAGSVTSHHCLSAIRELQEINAKSNLMLTTEGESA